MARIVSLGSALQDIYLVDHDDFTAADLDGHSIFAKLEIGTKVDVRQIHYFIGGGGTNAATTFARHGHESVFLGNIGHDSAGEAVIATLDAENINSQYIAYAPRRHTGCSVILLDAQTGERTILTHRGAAHKFDNLDAEVLREFQPDWLYITTLGGDIDTFSRFCQVARELNTRIMFNPGTFELADPHRLLQLASYVDILLVNQEEASLLAPDVAPSSPLASDLLSALLATLSNYYPSVIITNGSHGTIAADGTAVYRLGVYEDVKIKDTTGAGDAFGSGFLAHLAAGHSFRQSIIFGAANSTSVVQHLGAKAGILTGAESLHPMSVQKL